MGMLFGIFGLGALSLSVVVGTVSIVAYSAISRKLDNTNWGAWAITALVTCVITICFSCLPLAYVPDGQSSDNHGMSDEMFRALTILFVGVGLTPGIGSLAGFLALIVDKTNKPTDSWKL